MSGSGSGSTFLCPVFYYFESCREYLKECHKINKIIYLFYQITLLTYKYCKGYYKSILVNKLKAFVFIIDS